MSYSGVRNDMNEKHRRVTLRSVAEVAGVSLKTASNVINGTGRMTDETRKRVKAVIDDLGYRVNVAARNLNRGLTGFITLAVPSLTPPYLAQLANCVIDEAHKCGYSVYVTTYAQGSAKCARDVLRSFNPTVSDGIILSMSELEDISPEDFDVDYPLVVVGSRTTWRRADHVTVDDIDAAQTATKYMLEHGSSRLAVVGAREPLNLGKLRNATEGNAQLRLRGIVEECNRHHRQLDPALVGVTAGDWTIGAGGRAMRRLIDAGVPFDGVIALNDQLAFGALSALAAKGIRVPGQVQVIGFDNMEESAYLHTPLTSMDSCLDWTAPAAVKRIIGRINGTITTPELLKVKSEIIVRQTTRP
ncbi:LacI family DNA-binding transcriptional regulator [Bifidobacterium sp. ESL0784]|uniref:LacI family DNA-binding transcriptional regulator n=1 Tax=Bifidobacterium sp. ESL0784 TaxID=2983231 RepID=UPI0023F992A4|nr:LacI family DNA-binding transcriptional regulator [Bifidobacterium sp. ESL0784]MDF7640556.1 LacI family DNA-binding transcriptional regulator [Bifidobacterium sp. ESL0784]